MTENFTELGLMQPLFNERKRTAKHMDACDYYRVVYRKKQFKKHKTWDDDGYLTSVGGRATLLDGEGKEIASGNSKVSAEKEFSLGHYDLEITETIDKEDLKFGKTITESDHSIKLKPFAFKSLGKREKSVVLIKDTKPRHDPTVGMIILLI
jgi:DNA repair and recombination protein RAD54B